MAVLSNPDRAAESARYQSDASNARDQLAGVTRADIRAAIDAADTWADSNAASYNAALPLPARTALTAKQKAQILMYVIRRRYEVT